MHLGPTHREMSDTREETERLLSEKGDAESALRSVLAADAEAGRWTFDDVDVDSGLFGELVSRGLVEKTDEGYTVTDRDGIAVALDGQAAAAGSRDRLDLDWPSLRDLERPDIDRSVLGALAFCFAVLVVLRVLPYPAVFRTEDVVLMGNDPYMYRYWNDVLLAEFGAFDPRAFSDLPPGVRDDDVTFHLALWLLATLYPGDAGVALAWSPVLAAVVAGVAVYYTAAWLTPDRRVAIAAVLMLAITPAHAYRSSIGFADHHAFDFMWLAITLAALVALRNRPRERTEFLALSPGRDWTFAGLLGVAVTGQVLGWRGSPIVLAPLAAYVVVLAALDVREGRSPARHNRFLVVGLTAAALVSAALFAGFGWGEVHRAMLPGAVLLGTVAVFGVSELGVRLDVPSWLVGLAGVLAGGLVGAGLWFGTSIFDWMIERGSSWLFGALGRNTAGTLSLIGPTLGGAAGPILIFGLVMLVAFPVVLWLTVRVARGDHTEWAAPLVYFWYLLVWTVPMIRFGGSLSVPLAPFAGYGLAVFVGKVDFTGVPFLDGTGPYRVGDVTGGVTSGPEDGDGPFGAPIAAHLAVVGLLIVFLLVGSMSFIQIPANQGPLQIDGDSYETATWIRGDAAERGLEYPENYVFSRWGRNTVYNYFVNGQSFAYIYAEDNFEDFQNSDAYEQWYDRLEGIEDPAPGAEERLEEGVGYIVLERRGINYPEESLYTRLFEHHSSATESMPGLEHYRTVYVSSGWSRKVFTLVPGAIVTGTGPADKPVTVRTPVDLEHDSFSYRREVVTTDTGRFAVRVPYPGTYESPSDGVGFEERGVAEATVRSGGFVSEPTGNESHWTFNESRGQVVFDETSRRHGLINGTEWVDSPDGGALDFDGDARVEVPVAPSGDTAAASSGDAESSLTLTARFRAADSVDDSKEFMPIVAKGPSSGADLRSSGYALALTRGQISGTVGDGSDFRHLEGPRVDDGEWHRATLIRDGGEVRLYLDGELVQRRDFEASGAAPDHPLYVGGPRGSDNFVGEISDVRFRPEPVDSPPPLENATETAAETDENGSVRPN